MQAFRKMEEVTRVEVIAKARIPLLKVLFGTIQVPPTTSTAPPSEGGREADGQWVVGVTRWTCPSRTRAG